MLAPLHVVQPRQLQGRLVGLGTARDEPDPRHLGRRHLEQALGQPLLWLVREVVVVEVGDALGLLGGGRRDLGHAVAEARDHGPAGAGIEDAPAIGRDEPDPSPRSMFGYARSSERGNTLVGSAPHPFPAPRRASSAPPVRARSVSPSDVAQVPLQQLPRHPAALRRPPFRLLEQRIGIDTVGIELVAVRADPVVHDLRRHLGMELQTEAPSGDEGLRSDVGLGDQGRLRRKR